MKLNTRLHGRIRYQTWVRVIPKAGAGLLSHIEDISTAGLGLEHDQPMATDIECHVYFMLPLYGTEHIVQARCRIAGCRPTETPGRYHLGLAFIDFVSDPRATSELIDAFVDHLNATQSDPPAQAS
ncbi:PilZ domain-containing protein [Chitinimonas sp. BJYL2]|uniref:PilZ domain-containing protein n=1 Tax=Chitinimonas sp. BJYL2 TaxID=2976696 RepID=UPI0022B48C8F|nr:PilZ domain-containing protein [Chitinimonas sp. BJYL2]